MKEVLVEDLRCTTIKLICLILTQLQGAILQSKAERSSVPIERFKHLIFSTLLR
jgi:hypothetical protein